MKYDYIFHGKKITREILRENNTPHQIIQASKYRQQIFERLLLSEIVKSTLVFVMTFLNEKN